jgi:predicted metal-binding membrane protein
VTAREVLSTLPIRAAFAAALAVLIAAAWVAMWASSGSMSSMIDGLLAATCESMPMTVHASSFLLMWTAMVAAMMLPGEAPTLVSKSSTAFIGGYLAVWLLAGPFALIVVHVSASHPGAWAAPAAAAIFVIAGLYQFSPAKMTRDGGRCRDEPPTVAGGIRHGLLCFRSSGPLMAVMLVVGVMNLVWCAVIAVAVATEKELNTGRLAVQMAYGVVLVAIGLSIAVHPAVLPDIAMRNM